MADAIRTLVTITRSPFQGTRARDAIEAAMTCAVFGQTVSVLLIDDGVYCLTASPPRGSGLRDLSAMLDALPHYDVHHLAACSASLASRIITPPDPVRRLDQAGLSAWFRSHDRHLSF